MTARALPLDVRLRLGHAAVQVIADQVGAEIVHLKGHSVDPDLYPPGRSSSDVDVMVRPDHVALLVPALQRAGWDMETSFASGSLFRHAMTLRNERYGHIDLHRLYPGLSAPAERIFDEVRSAAGRREICAIDCTVPSRTDQAVFILLHSARDGSRGPRDAQHLRQALPDPEWEAVIERARSWGAGGILAAALGDLDSWRDEPDYELWRVMSEGGSRWEILLARLRAERSLPGQARLVLSAMTPNLDHLAISLGHRPTGGDIAREMARRVRDTVRGMGQQVRGRAGHDR